AASAGLDLAGSGAGLGSGSAVWVGAGVITAASTAGGGLAGTCGFAGSAGWCLPRIASATITITSTAPAAIPTYNPTDASMQPPVAILGKSGAQKVQVEWLKAFAMRRGQRSRTRLAPHACSRRAQPAPFTDPA